PASSPRSATICASISRLTRIAGGASRVTLRVAPILPRRTRRGRLARSCASSGSKPGGRRNRRSSDRLLTLFSSQAQETPSASPSARANPVMLETPTAASLSSCRQAVIAGGAGANNAGHVGVQRTQARPGSGRQCGGRAADGGALAGCAAAAAAALGAGGGGFGGGGELSVEAGGTAIGTTGSASSPAARRYWVMLRLCSARVLAKTWPPLPSATK